MLNSNQIDLNFSINFLFDLFQLISLLCKNCEGKRVMCKDFISFSGFIHCAFYVQTRGGFDVDF